MFVFWGAQILDTCSELQVDVSAKEEIVLKQNSLSYKLYVMNSVGHQVFVIVDG
jgi:hypothetical protein